MKGTIKGLAAVVAMVAITACSDASPTESSFVATDAAAMAKAQPGPGTLTFSSSPSYSSQTSQTATGGLGTIDFTGSLQTPNPCYNVTAAHTGSGTAITVTVSAAYNGNICTQVITWHNYNGRISGLPAGNYTFTVVHDLEGSRSTAYSSQVLVL